MKGFILRPFYWPLMVGAAVSATPWSLPSKGNKGAHKLYLALMMESRKETPERCWTLILGPFCFRFMMFAMDKHDETIRHTSLPPTVSRFRVDS